MCVRSSEADIGDQRSEVDTEVDVKEVGIGGQRLTPVVFLNYASP